MHIKHPELKNKTLWNNLVPIIKAFSFKKSFSLWYTNCRQTQRINNITYNRIFINLCFIFVNKWTPLLSILSSFPTFLWNKSSLNIPMTSNSVILLSSWDTLKDFQTPTVKAILSDPIIHLPKIIKGQRLYSNISLPTKSTASPNSSLPLPTYFNLYIFMFTGK